MPSLSNSTLFSQSNFGEILNGQDGALWFADGNSSIGRITTLGAVTEYPVGVQPNGLTQGRDGTIWFTSGNSDQIGQITRVAES
ncbi:MAG: hypothetical protein WDO73_00345 [Ignavibacteriota bacterium]